MSFPATFSPGLKSTALGRILAFESRMHKRLGMIRPQRYLRLWQYYAGLNLPPNNVEQPLGLNYVQAICDKQVGFFFGEAEDRLFGWKVKPRVKEATPEDETAVKIRQWLDLLYHDNHGETLFYDAALNGSVYGDTLLQLRWDALERRVVIENVQPEFFHCRWDVRDMTKLTEIIVAYPIDRLDAYQDFGTYGNEAMSYTTLVNPDYIPGMGIYWEHWTPYSYRRWVDDFLVEEGPNPYMMVDTQGREYPGLLPFVHIPNRRVGSEFYGFGDAEPILLLQDELNRRMGDLGDIVNTHAHPITWLRKFHGDVEDLPVGPDAAWDLGTEGEAGILETKGSPITDIYIDRLLSMMFDTASVPEVAFGRQTRNNGRAQSSATAIQLILLPAVTRARAKRHQWLTGLRQLAQRAMLIQQINAPQDFGFSFEMIDRYEICPVFNSILPRDRMQTVNENMTLAINGLRSMKRALEDLDEEDIDAQIHDIKADMLWRAMLGVSVGGKNSDSGQGGSNALPGSMKAKPGQISPDPDAKGQSNPALADFLK